MLFHRNRLFPRFGYSRSVEIRSSLFVEELPIVFTKSLAMLYSLRTWYHNYGFPHKSNKITLLSEKLGFEYSYVVRSKNFKVYFWSVSFNYRRYWLSQGEGFFKVRAAGGTKPDEMFSCLLVLYQMLILPTLNKTVTFEKKKED